MKKVILLIALMATPIVSQAQSIFSQLEDMDGVDSVIVNKDAWAILSKFNPGGSEGNEVAEIFGMIEDLNELKVFSTDKKDVASTMEDMVKKSVKNNKLTELMRAKEDGSRAVIYVKTNGNKDFVSEVLMFVKGIDKRTKGISEAVVVSLTGKIDINKLSNLADKFTKK